MTRALYMDRAATEILTSSGIKVVEEERPRCRICGSFKVGRAGKHLRAMSNEIMQVYRCHKCGSSFTAQGYRGHKVPKEMIVRALQMVAKGSSLNATAKAVAEWRGKHTAPQTIAQWVDAFAPGLPIGTQPSVADAKTLQAIQVVPVSGPVIHLYDMSASRRVALHPSIREIVHHDVVRDHNLYQLVHGPTNKTRRLSIRQTKRLAKTIGLDEEQMEGYVRAIYAGRSGLTRPIRTRFPIKANGGYAFLLGLFYASGGIGEAEIKFAVDRAVGEYLRQEISLLIGEVPTFRKQGSVNHPAHGAHSVAYTRTMLEILTKFGLKTAEPRRLGKGKFVPSRYMTLGVPLWVRREPYFLHRFVEGYFNGLKTQAGLCGRVDERGRPHTSTYTNVKVLFCSRNERELMRFIKVVVDHLQKLGVYPGWVSKQHNDGRVMKNFCYGVHSRYPLTNLRKNVLIIRPMIRTKLDLALNRDPIVKQVVQRLPEGMATYVLGMLLEGPKSLKDLAADCPRRPYNMTQETLLQPWVSHLQEMGVVVEKDGLLHYEPSRFATTLAAQLMERYETTMRKKQSLAFKPLYRCAKCRTMGDTPTCESCGEKRPRVAQWELRRLWDPKAKKIADDLMTTLKVMHNE